MAKHSGKMGPRAGSQDKGFMPVAGIPAKGGGGKAPKGKSSGKTSLDKGPRHSQLGALHTAGKTVPLWQAARLAKLDGSAPPNKSRSK